MAGVLCAGQKVKRSDEDDMDDIGEKTIKIGNRRFERHGKTYICGILNVTPDSFSDGGKWNARDSALSHVEKMIGEGADIVDVGGESTRPGYTPVSEAEEISRVCPVIEGIKARFDIPVSLDTWKSGTAAAGIAAGADMINDIWGLRRDPDMAKVIAESGLPCCLVHNRAEAVYEGFITDVIHDLEESVRLATVAGVSTGRIILDPGVGFGKSYEQNLELLSSLERFTETGYPVLLGCSRKSVIGKALGLDTDERLEGTIAATAVGVMKGVNFVRVHDVKENVRAVRMVEAILNGRDQD